MNFLTMSHGQPERTNPKTYGHVSTQSILDRFTQRGWEVHTIQASKVRKSSKEGYQNHLVRLRHPDYVGLTGEGSKFEIVVMNSHDATRSLRLYSGDFRMACANGNVYGDIGQMIRLVHSKRLIKTLDERLDDFERNLPIVAERLRRLKTIETTQEMRDKIELVVPRILGIENKISTTDVYKYSATRVRRLDDRSNDLYTVANRAQETLIRGGLSYFEHDKRGVLQYKKTRGTKSLTEIVRRNTEFWSEVNKFVA